MRYILVYVVGLLGLVDSIYLLREHIYSGGATCTFESGLGSFFACDIVTTSQYAVVFGIPVALFGVVFYTMILLSVFLYRNVGSSAGRYAWWILSDIGVLGTVWFLYLQAFVLNAYCLYCLFSAFFVAIISYTAVRDYIEYKRSTSSAKVISFDDTPSQS